MNDKELAEEIERRRGGTDMLNSVLMRHQWDQIIAALRRGPERIALLERAYWIATGLNPALDLGPDAMGPPLTDDEIIEQAKLTASVLQERQPSGEVAMVLQCATEMCRTFADHADRCRVCTINWQNLKAALSAAEAEGRKG